MAASEIERIVDMVMQDQYDLMPEWAQKQLWANGIKIRSMAKRNPLSESERELAAKLRKEIKTNEPKLREIVEAEDRAKNGGKAPAVETKVVKLRSGKRKTVVVKKAA